MQAMYNLLLEINNGIIKPCKLIINIVHHMKLKNELKIS